MGLFTLYKRDIYFNEETDIDTGQTLHMGQPCVHTIQRWEVVEYKYFVTVLKYIFLVSVLYSTTFYFDFLHFEHKYLYFLLLTC